MHHDPELRHMLEHGVIVDCIDPRCPMYVSLVPAVYRQCFDQECPAFRLALPHSHFESIPPVALKADTMTEAEIIDFQRRWEETATQPTQVLDHNPVEAWLSLPLEGEHSIMQQAGQYVAWIETGQTKDVCKCEWIQHPTNGSVWGGDTSLECPIHSKEGLLLGFIEWLRKHD